MKRQLLILLLFCSLLLHSGCSDSAGATSETTNGVAVVYSDGSPAANVAVFVRPSDKLLGENEAPDTLHTRTNAKGHFDLDSTITPDNYLLELTDSNGMGFQCTPDTSNGQLLLPDTIVLKKQGLLVGSVQDLTIPDDATDREFATDFTVQIYGLDRVTKLNGSGNFSFSNLPVGDIRLHIVSIATADTVAESDKFEIYPDDTTTTGNYFVGGSLSEEIKIVLDLLALNNIDSSELQKCIGIQDNHIAHIYLDSRNIDTLTPEIGNLRLKTFSCARNNLTSVPKELGNLVDLYYIDLSYNHLQYLPKELANMSKVSEIDVEYNQLREIPESFIAENKLPHLHEIHVKGNCLTNLPGEIRQWLYKYSYEKNWQDYQTEWDD